MTAIASLCAIALIAVAPKETYRVTRVLRDGQTLKYTVTRTPGKGNDSMLLGGGGIWNVEVKVTVRKDGDTLLDAVRTVVKLDAEDSPYIPEEMLRRLRLPLKAAIAVHRDGSVEMQEGERTASEFAAGTPWFEDVFLMKVPARKIAKGDAWTDVRKVPSFRPDEPLTDQTFKYRLDGKEKLDGVACFRIAVSSILDRHIGAAASDTPGLPGGLKLTLHSEIRYTMFVACADGRVVKKMGFESTTIDAKGGPIPVHNTTAMNLLVKQQKGK